jgi:DNA-binding PadR family transcriptional regulator
MGKATDIVHGTIELLILKTIGMEPIQGWGAAKRIHELSHQVIRVREGSLHPALVRLHAQGLIRPHLVQSGNRTKRLYSLTNAGRAQLRKELARWDRLSDAVDAIVHPEGVKVDKV